METAENKTIILLQRPEDIDVTIVTELPIPDENGNRMAGMPVQLEDMVFVKREDGKVEFSAAIPESASAITSFTGGVPIQMAMTYPSWPYIKELLMKHGKTSLAMLPVANLLVCANNEKYIMETVIIPDSKSLDVKLYSINVVPITMEEGVKPDAE